MDPKQQILDQANKIKSNRFILWAAMASILWGEAFKIEEFLNHNKGIEVNLIKGDTKVLAATTAFADTTITIPNADDRRRLVCNVGLVFDAGITQAKVRGEVLIQIHKNMTVEWKRRTGKPVAESIMRYSQGFNHGLHTTDGYGHAESAATNVPATQLAGEVEQLIRKLAPYGVDAAMPGSIDLIEEGKSLTAEVRGLNGVTVAASHSGVNVTPYALVVDAV